MQGSWHKLAKSSPHKALAVVTAVLLCAIVLTHHARHTPSPLSANTSKSLSAYQPWCAMPDPPAAGLHPGAKAHRAGYLVTPFPTNFWFVKTVKTGSSTLTSVFNNICSNYGIQWVHTDIARLVVGVAKPKPDKMQETLDRVRNITDYDYFAITSHMWYDKGVADVLQPQFLFTAVRHPMERVHSHYVQSACIQAAKNLGWSNFAPAKQHQSIGPNACDVDPEFLVAAMQNDTIKTRWSFANTSEAKDQVYHYIKGGKHNVEDAVAQYHFIFTADRLNEGLVMFMLKYGLSFQDISYLPLKVRKGRYKSAAHVPLELNEFIMANNPADFRIWNIANARLDKEKAALQQHCGPDIVERTLRAFEQLLLEVSEECAEYVDWYKWHGFEAPYTYTGLTDIAFDSGNGFRCVKHVARRFMSVGPTSISHSAKGPITLTAEMQYTKQGQIESPSASSNWGRTIVFVVAEFLALFVVYMCGHSDRGHQLQRLVAARMQHVLQKHPRSSL